jgi:hypothetical protein
MKNGDWVLGFPRYFLAVLAATLALARTGGADSRDPKPPQVSVDFFYPPSLLIQHGTPRLVYEMLVSNYVPLTYVLYAIDVRAGSKSFGFSGDTLPNMMRFQGEKAATAVSTSFAPGQSAVIFFTLELRNRGDMPQALVHVLHFTSPDGVKHALTPEPLIVKQGCLLIVQPPLRGKDWIAGDATHNGPDAAHRRTILLLEGKPWLAQRYAIDWVRYRMVDGTATTWSGPEDKNASYPLLRRPDLQRSGRDGGRRDRWASGKCSALGQVCGGYQFYKCGRESRRR